MIIHTVFKVQRYKLFLIQQNIFAVRVFLRNFATDIVQDKYDSKN